SGIEGVPPGQWEACRALSLPAHRTWGAVVLPQAVRKVIPALGNYLIAMFKDTPLLFAITVGELMYQASRVGGRPFRYLEAMPLVGLFFLLVSVPSAIIIRQLERRYAAVCPLPRHRPARAGAAHPLRRGGQAVRRQHRPRPPGLHRRPRRTGHPHR